MQTRPILQQLRHHLPFTAAGALLSMAAVWLVLHAFNLTGPGASGHSHDESVSLFHFFHPIHILLSAIATVALYRHYDNRVVPAVWVGALGTAIPCGLSDYFLPYFGGKLLGWDMHLHVCLIQHPAVFISFLVMGLLCGLWANSWLQQSWLFSHAAHVFVSSSSSLLYLNSFGIEAWTSDISLLFPVFLVLVVAVWLPCCLSDVVIPVGSACRSGACRHRELDE